MCQRSVPLVRLVVPNDNVQHLGIIIIFFSYFFHYFVHKTHMFRNSLRSAFFHDIRKERMLLTLSTSPKESDKIDVFTLY